VSAAVVAILLLALAGLATARALRAAGEWREAPRGGRPFGATGAHYRRCYDRRGFMVLGGAALAAFVLAHTGVDEALDRAHAQRVRDRRSDAAADALRGFGERPWFLVWGVFALLDGLVATAPLLRWGRRNFEAMIVGLPALWSLQFAGGASRPTDVPGDAHWRPFRDDNTASGHTFMAAIPWLNAGRTVDETWLRGIAWLASWGTGWSRINDRKHYASQVLFGHEIAAQAVRSVAEPGPVADSPPTH
jgi:hypothetical protein